MVWLDAKARSFVMFMFGKTLFSFLQTWRSVRRSQMVSGLPSIHQSVQCWAKTANSTLGFQLKKIMIAIDNILHISAVTAHRFLVFNMWYDSLLQLHMFMVLKQSMVRTTYLNCAPSNARDFICSDMILTTKLSNSQYRMLSREIMETEFRGLVSSKSS